MREIRKMFKRAYRDMRMGCSPISYASIDEMLPSIASAAYNALLTRQRTKALPMALRLGQYKDLKEVFGPSFFK